VNDKQIVVTQSEHDDGHDMDHAGRVYKFADGSRLTIRAEWPNKFTDRREVQPPPLSIDVSTITAMSYAVLSVLEDADVWQRVTWADGEDEAG
jgi:hypothetical protein